MGSGADPPSGLLATSATLGQEDLAASAHASVHGQLDAISGDHMAAVLSISAAEVIGGARGTTSADAKEARNKNPLLSRLRGRTSGLPTLCATQEAPRFVLERGTLSSDRAARALTFLLFLYPSHDHF